MALREMTPEVRNHFETLAAAESGFLKRLFVSDQWLAIVTAIGRSRVPTAIPGLMAYAFAGPASLQRAAREAIDTLISSISPGDFPAFDQRMRAGGNACDRSWWEFKPSAVSRYAAGQHAVTMLGLFTSHSSGYVREEAVKQLAGIHDGREFAFLFVRLNDWVEAVRRRAATAVTERVQSANVVMLVRHLPLILRGETWGRGEIVPIVDSIVRLVIAPENEAALRIGLGSPEPQLSRACARVLTRLDEKGAGSLLQVAMQSGDAWVRFRAAQRSLQLVPDERLPELCGEIERDRATPMRRLALQTLAERVPTLAEAPLHRALLDRHPAVRELANYYLRSRGNFDSRAFYLDVLTSDASKRAIALRGLGETGQPEDVEAVRPYLSVNEAPLRKAGLAAAGRLSPGSVIPELLAALQDESPGISQTGARALASQVQMISAADFDGMLHPAARHTSEKTQWAWLYEPGNGIAWR